MEYQNTNPKSQGRKKIPVKRSNKNGTISKRRSAKKAATEPNLISGAELAVVVFPTPTQDSQTFSFGQPSADDVINRYLQQNVASSSNTNINNSPSHMLLQFYKQREQEALVKLEEEKKIREMIEANLEAERGVFDSLCWKKPVEEIQPNELDQYVEALKKLRKVLDGRLTEMENARASFMFSNQAAALSSYGLFEGDYYGGAKAAAAADVQIICACGLPKFLVHDHVGEY
ncbi:Agamous-like MADS-box protein [Quillaja saponaria]|uniref:Agamous-like MADS-box protein n=1 Tax=Quillaja saponaria TaxID=32244 RepID=A0AAD7PET8_QUISA|nr:Agamous-like MADS-box protein [Quillaja saponaria]